MKRRHDYLPESWRPVHGTVIEPVGSFVVKEGAGHVVQRYLLRYHPMRPSNGRTHAPRLRQ